MSASSLSSLPCACAEFTRVSLGPIEIPVGIVPLIVLGVALAVSPGVILGFMRRRRFARELALADGQRPSSDLA